MWFLPWSGKLVVIFSFNRELDAIIRNLNDRYNVGVCLFLSEPLKILSIYSAVFLSNSYKIILFLIYVLTLTKMEDNGDYKFFSLVII